MNDHNLDDLIIDTIAPKNNKTKNFLTIVALLIIVLIVAIILTKTLLKAPETNELSFEENMSEMIAPELKLQKPTEKKSLEIAKPKDEPPLAHIIEEEISAPQKVEEEIAKPTAIIKEETITPIVNENILKTEKEIVKPIDKEKEIEIEKQIAKPMLRDTQKPKETANKETVKKETKKPAVAPVKQTSTTTKFPKTSSTGKYYIQVSSFKSVSPSARLLSVIKSSGFNYHVSKPDRTGYKKLLIGPYKTRVEVDKARDIVRDRILKSAFVVEK